MNKRLVYGLFSTFILMNVPDINAADIFDRDGSASPTPATRTRGQIDGLETSPQIDQRIEEKYKKSAHLPAQTKAILSNAEGQAEKGKARVRRAELEARLHDIESKRRAEASRKAQHDLQTSRLGELRDQLRINQESRVAVEQKILELTRETEDQAKKIAEGEEALTAMGAHLTTMSGNTDAALALAKDRSDRLKALEEQLASLVPENERLKQELDTLTQELPLDRSAAGGASTEETSDDNDLAPPPPSDLSGTGH